MIHPRRILPFLIAALLLAAAGWHLYAIREPSYQGKTLTEWLDVLNHVKASGSTEAAQATAAIHAIGKDGLPTLVLMLQAHDSALKQKWMAWAQKKSWMNIHGRPAMKSRYLAMTGFEMLGPQAKDAIPALAALLPDPNYGSDVARCLVMTGSEAIPILRSGLSNVNASVRIACLAGLDSAGTNGFAALPAILPCLHDPNHDVRWGAVFCLRNFQHEEATVWPALWQIAQQDQDNPVRIIAIWVMGTFSERASAYGPGLQKMLLSTNANDVPLFESLTNALKNIDPAAWPNGGGSHPAGSSTNRSPVGPAFQPAGSGGFPAPSSFDGPASPSNRQPGKSALRDPTSPRTVDKPARPVQAIP